MPENIEPIGKVSATEKNPTTVDEFYFWLKEDTIVRPFDLVKVSSYRNSRSFAVIEEIVHITDSPGHLGSYVSSDFGDPASSPATRRLGLTYAKCRVLSNLSSTGDEHQIDMPIKDGTSVFFVTEEEIVEALGLRKVENPIPGGFVQMSNNTVAAVNLNASFLLGPEGAHLNISGISGLATKTSYAMFLLLAIQQKLKNTAFIILNVKGKDLLCIDEPSGNITEAQKNDYLKAEMECLPFSNVKYFYPYGVKDNSHSKTFLESQHLEGQHNSNKAANYIYTYGNDATNLDLLFSNIDDPNFTMDSILSEISESPEFKNLNTWDDFMERLAEKTISGAGKNKEIPVQSWRKFKRLITKSLRNDVFVPSINPTKRQVHLSGETGEIGKIKNGDVYVIDIAKLDEQLQCFVFGDIIKSVHELQLNDNGVANPDKPQQIIVFVDELNKYASSSAPKSSPILSNILV